MRLKTQLKEDINLGKNEGLSKTKQNKNPPLLKQPEEFYGK